MIIVNYGDGKGKTTAAMGTVMRAVSNNWKVVVVQFLKARETGEVELLKAYPNVKIIRDNNLPKFSFAMNDEERVQATAIHTENLQRGIDLVKQGECDMLVLDEMLGVIETGLVDEAPLKDLLANKPEDLELIITGRMMPDYVEAAADYITEMRLVRHPFAKGTTARKGVEF